MSEVETQEAPEKREKPEIITVYVVDGFVVMFTSLSMIMLAFFIMLNALAVPDEKREKAAIGSLMGAFGVLPEGVGLDETGSYMASLDYVSMRDEMVLFAAFEAFLDEDWHTQEILSYVDEDGRRRIRFTESFLFDSGSEKLDPKMYPVLDRLAAMLRTLERPIIVEDTPTRNGGDRLTGVCPHTGQVR